MNKQYFEKDLIVNNQKIKGAKLQYVKLIPDANKCFMNKNTKHKFIHTKTGKGLMLEVLKKDENLYEEVRI